MSEIITQLEIDTPPDTVSAFFSDPSNRTGFSQLIRPHRPERGFEVGAPFNFKIAPRGMIPMNITTRIRVYDQGHLMWRGGRPGFWGEHYFRTEPLDDGARTRWIHGERFGGLLSKPILFLVGGKLEAAYRRFNRELAGALSSP